MRRIALVAGMVIAAYAAQWAEAQFGAATGTPSEVVERLRQSISQKGYQRVGVMPRFVCRDENGRESLQGPNAAHAALFAERIEEELVKSAGSRYSVISSLLMQKAFADVSLEDVKNLDRLREIAKRVEGLDALIVGTVADEMIEDRRMTRPGMRIRCELVEINGGTSGGIVSTDMTLSLGSEAYRGRSFELRRWMDSELVNLRLNALPFGGAPDPFKDGDFNANIGQSPWDIREGPHPLADPTCPFRLEMLVDERPRPITWIGRQHDAEPYVDIGLGERYSLRVENRTTRNACVAIFVDGINILGKRRESPGNCLYWILKKDSQGNFKGWYTGEEGNYDVEEFVTARAAQSLAARQGFTESLGQITAVFYTVGVPLSVARPEPFRRGRQGAMERSMWTYDWDQRKWELKKEMLAFAPAPGSAAPGMGTAAGHRSQVRLNEFQGEKPGLILAAITLHYTTPDRLRELRYPGLPPDNPNRP